LPFAAYAQPPSETITPPSTVAPMKTPTTNLAPIDLEETPEQCHAIAKQAGSRTLSVALSARISLASCLADVKVAELKLLDCEASMLEIEEALQGSFELVDEVIAATTEDSTKIVAEQARAELYTNATVRMLATIPPPGGTEASIALHTARKGILDGLLARWRDAAAVSYESIVERVKKNPKLEKNPVVAKALHTAKDRLRMHVASAPKPVAPAPVEQPEPPAEEELR
jgi:hypothetical protein